MNAQEPRYTAAVACAVVGVAAPTLRAWRNNNGLLDNPDRQNKWHRFSLADLCVIRFVAQATKGGLSAEAAVTFSKLLWLAFAMLLDGEEHSPFALITDEQCAFMDPANTIADYIAQRRPKRGEVSLFVDLKEITAFVMERIAEVDGKPVAGEAK